MLLVPLVQHVFDWQLPVSRANQLELDPLSPCFEYFVFSSEQELSADTSFLIELMSTDHLQLSLTAVLCAKVDSCGSYDEEVASKMLLELGVVITYLCPITISAG